MAGDADSAGRPRRVSKYEYAFRAGRGEPVELADEHVDEHVDEATLEQLTAPALPAAPNAPVVSAPALAPKAPAGKK